MKHVLLSLCFLITSLTWAQHPGSGYCKLKPDNKSWVLEFKDAKEKEEKVNLIVDRIFANADYYQDNPAVENIDDRSTFGEVPCSKKCSIRFVLVYGKSKAISLDLSKHEELETIIDQITPGNIAHIDFNEHRERDIYKHQKGERSGIVMYTKDKELIKTIKRTLKEIRRSS